MSPGMTQKQEVVLSYDRDRWRAQGDGLQLEHRELRDLDALIGHHFQNHPVPMQVQVRFDLSQLPIWLRQYQTHYFNYVLNVPQK